MGRMMRKGWLVLLLAWGWGCMWGQVSKSETKRVLRVLQGAPTYAAVLDSLRGRDVVLDSASVGVFRAALWEKYQQAALLDSVRLGQYEGQYVAVGKDTMRYRRAVKGSRPARGYPVYIALHGGGCAPKEVNDQQWQVMGRYYLGSIDTGIYVAPRGMTDTWNLHFVDEAYACYQRLMGDLRVYGGADPERIYLLGYSAGGDGVYQLAPRLASGLAAVNMSAGHHNGVSPVNLQHVPMALQVGELDGAYDRNKETVRYSLLLDSLRKAFPGDYRHALYVHAQKEHSHVQDRQGKVHAADVVCDAWAWYRGEYTEVCQEVTDGPTWVSMYRQSGHPLKLHWDAGTCVPGGVRQYYWLKMEGDGKGEVNARVDTVRQVLYLQTSDSVRVGLHEDLFPVSSEVEVVMGARVMRMPVTPSLYRLAQGLQEYEDPRYAYWGEVVLQPLQKAAPNMKQVPERGKGN